MTPTERIRNNLARIRDRIEAACRKSGRKTSDVTLVAVTKSAKDSEVESLIELGVRDLAENHAIEGAARARKYAHRARWHFVGHLQTNKSAKVVEAFQVLHSLDRDGLAEDLERKCAARERRLPVFIQVNVSGESTKGGYRPEEVAAVVAASRPHLEVAGLMTMAPAGDPEAARPHFRGLKELAARCGVRGLSMGMSEDFEVAIEEGATHIRVGTALFASS